MLNYIWCGMIIIAVAIGILTGKSAEITNAVINGGQDAVTLAITMAGVVAVWTGILRIGEKAGVIDTVTRKIEPLMDFLFPEIKRNKKAKNYIATNLTANFLGLGWAATPAGLMAMKELSKCSENKYEASDAMCMFMIINMSSVQLITINIIAYRMQYGSVNPSEIIAPGIAATLVSTAVAVFFAKIMALKSGKR